MRTPEEKETAELVSPAALPQERWVLHLVSEAGAMTYPLQAGSEVCIGRARDADIQVEAASLSRRHALLQIGPPLRIKDLGSSNGTSVGQRRLPPDEWADVQVGELVELGEVIALVQRTAAPPRARRIWSHGAFEARLEAACADRGRRPFAVVRIKPEDGAAPASKVVEALWPSLGTDDCLALYAPGEYELLIGGADAGLLEGQVGRMLSRLSRDGVAARAGTALFPRDGTDPEQLMAQAGEALHGRLEEGEEERPVVVDPAMRQLYQVIDKVAQGTINVLIQGETGAGKERVAEAVHRSSPRRAGPYLRLNCAAFTESLLESELFGHEKGAFTGAVQARPGLLESANGGTVFLDEVGELPQAMQSKLLRVLEERAVRRVGALKTRPIDVRFIAATNRDLEEEVTAGRFRRDLYFRLAGITLAVPPLRERPAEIEPLARMFARQVGRSMGRAGEVRLSPGALEALKRYAWPGNIRELRNVIERAVLLCTSDTLGTEHLPQEKMAATWMEPPRAPTPSTPARPASPPSALPLRSAPRGGEEERQRILDALQQCAGNQTRAAKLLGISRRTLLYRLDELGLPRPQKKASEEVEE